MKAWVIGAALAVMAVGGATADVIKQRQEILKTFGPVGRDGGAMLRGEAPFDLPRVQAMLAVLKEGVPKLPALFPDGSFSGDTKALPRIAQERTEFNAIWTKLEADVAAAQTGITDAASFRTRMGTVLGNCGACHRPYRAQ